MYTIDLTGRTGMIFGVANHRSLAWAIAEELGKAGARLAFSYQGERLKENVAKLAAALPGSEIFECDVTDDAALEKAFAQVGGAFGHLDFLVHSVAFARKEDLEGAFRDTSRDGYRMALEISAYSLLPMARLAAPLMKGRNGSVVALTYLASQRVVPNYNVMGSAKAALEHSVRQLAFELGPMGIRVNAISAGAINTLSARGISGFTSMLSEAREKAPLGRNVTAEEVGKSALFLLSDLGSGVTGETLHVDAGYHVMGV
ncbi:MAG TPA: enoyl-ACP reductase [Candidatus Eisenbacteria bacterium]